MLELGVVELEADPWGHERPAKGFSGLRGEGTHPYLTYVQLLYGDFPSPQVFLPGKLHI